MAFKFKLETVLKHRKRLEEIAQREFAEAQAAVDVVLQVLESMYQRMDEVRAEISQAQHGHGPGQLDLVRNMEGFIVGQKIRIEAQRLEARRLLVAAEEKQELLIAAARERKVLVKLKEKRLTEYREWLNQIETKMADDQSAMNRARQRR